MSNALMIQIMVLLLLIFTFLITYFIKKGLKQISDREKFSIFRAGKVRKKSTLLLKMYSIFVQWPITKKYIQKITWQYEILLPGDRFEIKKQAMKTALIVWILDAVIIFLLVVLRPSSFSIYKAIITITYMYLINNQTLYLIYRKRTLELNKQFDKFIGDNRHRYQVHGMVDEAIYEVLENAKFPIKLHIAKIYDVLNSENIDEEVQKYKETTPNRFLKIFLSLSVMMIKFGDKKIDKQSLYLMNLRYLKQEVNIEINRIIKANWLFSGLIFINTLPILFLEPIKDWAISCYAGLKDYYMGALGIVTVVLIFLATLSGINIINKLKDTGSIEIKKYIILDWLSDKNLIKNLLNNIINKNYGRTLRMQELLKRSGENISVKQFLLKRILYAIAAFIGCIIIAFSIHGQNRTKLVTDTDSISFLSSMCSEKQTEIIKDSVLIYVQKYKNETVSAEEIEKDLIAEGVIKSKELATLTAQEIVNRINAYKYEYFKWYELLLAFIVSGISYQMPYLFLIVLKKIRKMIMDDEVIQFHSIILMLMYMDRISIETILEWMENFSVIFKKSLQECLNNLQVGDVEALEELKKKEPYEPFVRIIENLQMCDKLPIERAFDEISVERFNYQENRKLENEIYTKDKSLIGWVIAWIPAVMTVTIYLIIPWVIESLTQLIAQMSAMANYNYIK